MIKPIVRFENCRQTWQSDRDMETRSWKSIREFDIEKSADIGIHSHHPVMVFYLKFFPLNNIVISIPLTTFPTSPFHLDYIGWIIYNSDTLDNNDLAALVVGWARSYFAFVSLSPWIINGKSMQKVWIWTIGGTKNAPLYTKM